MVISVISFSELQNVVRLLLGLMPDSRTLLKRPLSGLIESLGNTTATAVKTCLSTIAFLLQDKGDHKLYPLEHSSTP